MIQLTSQGFSVNCPFKSLWDKKRLLCIMRCYRTPLSSSVTVSQLLMDIKHRAEEIHKHNWVSRHLQGGGLAPYICVRTHKCHKITCHYWADRMDSTYCLLNGLFLKRMQLGWYLKIMLKRMPWCRLARPPLLSTTLSSRESKDPYSITFQTSISVCIRLVRADGLKGSH